MENFKGLIDWSLSHKDDLKLQFESMKYISEWLPNHFDIRATVEDGYSHVGRSVSAKDLEAVGKALIEVIERAARSKSKLQDFSGFAAHFDRTKANLSAALELVERDAVLSHFLRNEPFFPEDLDLINELGGNLHFIEKSNARNVKWALHRAESFYIDCDVIICSARSEMPDGERRIIFGFGAACGNERRRKAAEHALLECIQNVPLLISGFASEAVTLESFRELDVWQPVHHGLLGLDIEYATSISHLFPKTGIQKKPFRGRSQVFDVRDFEIQELEMSECFRDLRGIITVAYARHADLIPYRVGFYPDQNLKQIPHFIG